MELLTPLSDPEQRLLRETLGLRCQKARTQLGLSQRALAETMGRSPSWVREIERGDQYAPPYLIQALARATGRTAAWFYGHEGPGLEKIAERLAAEVQRALAGVRTG